MSAQASTSVPRLITEIIAERAHEQPAHTALRQRGETLSYGQLDARARRLAAFLAGRGIGREDRVAIAIRSGFDQIVAVLGVLRAGAAYVPLALDAPEDRMRRMLALSDPRLILLDRRAPGPTLVADERAFFLGEDWHQVAMAEEVEPERPALDNQAYVVFTSGSTGRPKGVVICHRGLENLVRSQQRAFAMSPASRVLQYASFSFDAAVSEILVTLFAGATLVLPDARDGAAYERMPGPPLTRVLQREAITHVTLPPTVLPMLNPADLPALQTVVSAGEACSAQQVARWAPHVRFVNAYGPSEATVCATEGACQSDAQPPPLGESIRGVSVYLVDTRLERVADGEVGEVCIASAGLARGYLDQRGLTAAAFVPDPWGPAGARMYRTGDLARRRPDGALEFVGRADRQIKLRGYRIELGDIEAHLRRCDGVADAVAFIDERAGAARLLAYALLERSEPNVDTAATTGGATAGITAAPAIIDRLRAHLAAALPPYMIPDAIGTVTAWPQTAHGKLDRAALPSLVFGARPSVYIELNDDLELAIEAIWSRILAIRPIGSLDDFFAIGGNSLLAMRMLATVQQDLGVEVGVAEFYRQPTITGLATRLRAGGLSPTFPLHLPLTRQSAPQRLYIVAPVSGSALCYIPIARRLEGQFELIGLQAPAFDPARPVARDLIELASEHLRTLVELQPHGPYLLAGWSAGAAIALEMAVQLHARDEPVDRVTLIEPIASTEYFRYWIAAFGELSIDRVAPYYVRNACRCVGKQADVDDRDFAGLDRERLLDQVDASLRANLGACHPLWSKAELASRLRVFEQTIQAYMNFDTMQPYAGSVTLIVGRELHPYHGARSYDFGDLLQGPVELIQIPGSHYTVVSEEYADHCVQAMLTGLADVRPT